jgi:hypothetical protein
MENEISTIPILPEWSTPRLDKLERIRDGIIPTNDSLLVAIIDVIDTCGTLESVRQFRHWLARQRELSY